MLIRVRSTLARIDDVEPGALDQVAEFGEREQGGVEIGRLARHLVGVQRPAAAVNGYQQGATGYQNPGHFPERGRDPGARNMDERVEADDAGERTVGNAQGCHIPLGKGHGRVRELGLRHHAGREVDAHRIDGVGGQEGTYVPRAASEVADGVVPAANRVNMARSNGLWSSSLRNLAAYAAATLS